MKMPSLDSSYQPGSGLESIEAQLGWYVVPSAPWHNAISVNREAKPITAVRVAIFVNNVMWCRSLITWCFFPWCGNQISNLSPLMHNSWIQSKPTQCLRLSCKQTQWLNYDYCPWDNWTDICMSLSAVNHCCHMTVRLNTKLSHNNL